MDKNISYLIASSHFIKFGPKKIALLKKCFKNNFEAVWEANESQLETSGIDKNSVREFCAFREKNNLENILEPYLKENIQTITIEDNNYPALLKEIPTPPPFFHYKGDIKILNHPAVAIVGSRKHTQYGERVARDITAYLSQKNVIIVSGLALGIDAIAHQSSLDNNGLTVGILGSGLDEKNIYPSSNRTLAKKILESGGLIISEFPCGMPGLPQNFPQRNRLIAGITLGTIVIEAGERSGSLITANLANEMGREVFAMPGNIYNLNSLGTNTLIKNGATIITKLEDIDEILNLPQAQTILENKISLPASDEEAKIIALLRRDALHINDIIREATLDTKTANSTLAIMEMKGLVKNLGNMIYSL